MEDKTKVIIVIVAILILGLPLASRLVRDEPAPQPGAATAVQEAAEKAGVAPRVAADPVPAPGAAVGKAQRAAPRPAQQPQAAPQPALQMPPAQQLNAQSLTNTAWSFQGATIQLFPAGRATANVPGVPMPVDARWSVTGSNVTVSAMGQNYTAQISGNQLLMNGVPAQRIR